VTVGLAVSIDPEREAVEECGYYYVRVMLALTSDIEGSLRLRDVAGLLVPGSQ
jgi:hypothetical protein